METDLEPLCTAGILRNLQCRASDELCNAIILQDTVCFRERPFHSIRNEMVFLFHLFQQTTVQRRIKNSFFSVIKSIITDPRSSVCEQHNFWFSSFANGNILFIEIKYQVNTNFRMR
jgi:hypothetical protein